MGGVGVGSVFVADAISSDLWLEAPDMPFSSDKPLLCLENGHRRGTNNQKG